MRQEVKLTLDSDVSWCLPTLECVLRRQHFSVFGCSPSFFLCLIVLVSSPVSSLVDRPHLSVPQLPPYFSCNLSCAPSSGLLHPYVCVKPSVDYLVWILLNTFWLHLLCALIIHRSMTISCGVVHLRFYFPNFKTCQVEVFTGPKIRTRTRRDP